ncbi:MAG: DUF4493 domain-containing protein [Bacteroidales bacterium]|nr:DUF4493 domain-containing protein [Bacteroidales bacterium]
MKRIITLAFLAAAFLAASCTKEKNFNKDKETEGTLSFASFTLEEDQEVITKATAASGNYSIFIYDADDNLKLSTTYSAIKAGGNKVSLTAGKYTLVARSTEEEVPFAAFESPVYGASTEVTVNAGQTTDVGSLTCTLLQCKVTVSYSDDFLEMVTGPGVATVTVTAGHPLDYAMTYANGGASYDSSAGYFAVNSTGNTTMEVTFKGSVEGKSQRMTKTFTGITAKQWRQVRFIKKVDGSGNATFDIVIDSFVNDEDLNNGLLASENVIGDDPSAPKGDGGISLEFDYANGCDSQFADMSRLVVPTMAERNMSLVFKVNVPNGIKKFVVLIDSSNDAFLNAVAAAEASTLDLINPSEANMMIFDVVPFPHGADMLGQTAMSLNLSASQEAILNFAGTHTFTMVVTDNKGCKNSIPVTMVVR